MGSPALTVFLYPACPRSVVEVRPEDAILLLFATEQGRSFNMRQRTATIHYTPTSQPHPKFDQHRRKSHATKSQYMSPRVTPPPTAYTHALCAVAAYD